MLANTYYAYINRGKAYTAKDDFEHGIDDFNKAIDANPNLKFAYCERGIGYTRKGDVDLAIADFDHAIRLDPQYLAAYGARGAAYKLKGNLDLAMADYDQVVRLDPKDLRGYRSRAMVHWENGSLAKSLMDFDEALRLNPKSAYPALWREIIGKRSDELSQLADAAKQFDMTKWPAPIVNLFLGASTPEQAMAAADDPDPKKRRGQMCEANFYTAEFALQHGSRQDARRLLVLAAADCPKTFIESQAASFELKALDARP